MSPSEKELKSNVTSDLKFA